VRKASGTRVLFDGAFLVLLTIVVGPALAAVAWIHAALRLPLVAEAFLVPLYAYAFLAALLTLTWLVRALLPRLEPGTHRFPSSRMAVAWLLHFALQRVVGLPIWSYLFFAFATLRWLLLRALGCRAGFNIDTSVDALVIDASLVEIGDEVMLGAGSVLVGHFMENDTIRLARVRLGTAVQVLGGAVVSPGVVVGDECVLGPESKLLPYVQVGENVHIGMGTVLHQNVKVGDNAVIGHHVIVDNDAVIGAGAVIQSGARVARGTEIPEGSRYP
jgi:acetyltransferase-like isoleucine patch superfamily enzyme